ncbi:MAG: KpsF/GutQ family sugar-phosphate isomerase [Boseongicola sp.]|nr:KpsF/GutQ family sugar-phosphate isomerase [Boseongicola sp.]MDD9977571.1 KpsF/GutQ family sugar-phosphate isomerase [Boseongicola sp.]
MSHLDAVTRALATDAEGLQALANALPGMRADIDKFVQMVADLEGRLIVTGLGKSGHVGTKLAATFSSTGTPAYFLHPSEASHGDLGMVQPGDAVLALSWSGETRELSDVIGYAKRRAVPLIAMCGDAGSTLAEAADLSLILPQVREACPHNLAPTTSTLVQMALGDALAIALLESKGFDAESFHGFHPGGSLGAALKRVNEVMHGSDALPLVDKSASVFDGLSVLSERGFGIVGVIEDASLAGVVTDGDIRRYLAENADAKMKTALHETTIEQIMTRGSVTLAPDDLVGEAMAVLQAKRISAAFVVDNDAPAGLVTMLRLLNRGAA